MTMKTRHVSRWMLVAAAAVVGSALEVTFLSSDAHAVVGRPLTPFSYAGVARRTTRRAVTVGAATHPYGYAAPVAVPTPVPAPYPAPAPPPYPPPTNYYW
jgi:hypothetical protein